MTVSHQTCLSRVVPLALGFSLLIRIGFSQDNYVVLDRATDRGLFLVTPAGAISPLTPTVPWQHANSVARDGQGNFIVAVNVSDAAGSADGVYRVSPDGQVTAVAVGDPFDSPRGVAVDAAGNYAVLNYIYADNSTQILRVTPAGLVQVLLEGRPLRHPTGITIDAQGDYIITDRGTAGRLYSVWTYLPENGAVYRFNPTTRLTTTVRSSVDENDNVKFDDLMGHLTGVAIDPDGNYIVVEAPPHLDDDGEWEIPIGDTYLLRMRPDGEILQTIHIPTLDDAYCIGLGVAIDSQGDYIVADAVGISSDRGRLLRVTPAGDVSSIILTTVLGIPGGVVVVPGAPPTPPAPRIAGMSLIPGEAPPRVRFSWMTETGKHYRIQRASRLDDNSWADLAFPISGTGALIEFSEQCAGPEPGFYRIRVID